MGVRGVLTLKTLLFFVKKKDVSGIFRFRRMGADGGQSVLASVVDACRSLSVLKISESLLVLFFLSVCYFRNLTAFVFSSRL